MTVTELGSLLSRTRPLPYTLSRPIQRALAHVLTHYDEPLSLDELASVAGMTRHGFCRRFQRECNISPIRWLWAFRTQLAAELIGAQPEIYLVQVADACGFTSLAHFSRAFRSLHRQAPSAYRDAARSRLKTQASEPHKIRPPALPLHNRHEVEPLAWKAAQQAILCAASHRKRSPKLFLN